VSYPSRSRIDYAHRDAAALLAAGWLLVRPGTIARLRAQGRELHYEFCSRLTGESRDTDGRVAEILWDLWYRRRVDAPPPADVSTCADDEERAS